MTELCKLAKKYGTDKGADQHNYTPYYSIFFEALKFVPLNLLEIGIDKGASVQMWNDYFKSGEIHGIDLRGDYQYLFDEGITTHIVDQSKKGELIVFGEQYKDYYSIIVDDGSHASDDQIITFEILFPYLKSGGYYCVEDLLCDYDSRWNKGRSSIEYFKQLVSDVNMNGLVSNDRICANKHDAVKRYKGTYLQNNIEFAFYSMGLLIIKKI